MRAPEVPKANALAGQVALLAVLVLRYWSERAVTPATWGAAMLVPRQLDLWARGTDTCPT